MVEPPKARSAVNFVQFRALSQENGSYFSPTGSVSAVPPQMIRRFLPRFVRFQRVAATFPSDLQFFLRSDRVEPVRAWGSFRDNVHSDTHNVSDFLQENT
jgi:hypothetical protein